MRLGIFGRGRLGSAVADAARAAGHDVAWILGRDGAPSGPTPDAVVDASSGDAVPTHLAWCVAHGAPCVVGATGLRDDAAARRAAERIGVVLAPNFSLAVALFVRFAAALGRFAATRPEFDAYVAEKHRATKRDAPSGTARLVAETVIRHCPRKTSWRLADAAGPRPPEALSVGVVRGGFGAGEISLALESESETFTLRHEARGPGIYGAGALAAAAWIRGRTGLHRMDDVVRELLDAWCATPEAAP